MAFPEGLPEKKDKFLRPGLRQPKLGFDTQRREAGPGAADSPVTPEIPSRARRRDKSKKIDVSSVNVHGLRSKSEQMYPEAYAPVETVFWEGLSDSQQAEVMRLQAVAQEKVGYERGTPKYFIEDFDPRKFKAEDSGEQLVAITAPRFVLGGVLLGAGLTLGLGLLLREVGGTDVLVICAALLLIGAGMIAYGSN